MAFNGITVACLVNELNGRLSGGRISKIVQTESDELMITVRTAAESGGGQARVLLSADASLPLLYLTDSNKPAPATAPAFCMLLRKHIGAGRILSVTQPGLERVIRFRIEHLNEMGDLTEHTLIIELMGKHSNIIFVDSNEQIVDSIRRVNSMMSSVREVLPGREYFIPETRSRINPLEETKEGFISLLDSPAPPAKLISGRYTGFASVTGEELVSRAGIVQDMSASAMSREEKDKLYLAFRSLMDSIRKGSFSPVLYRKKDRESDRMIPCEFSALPLSIYSLSGYEEVRFSSMSSLLETFYSERMKAARVRQRTADLRHTVSTLLERDVHKLDLQEKQLEDTRKMDRFRLCGELLTTWAYQIEPGLSSCEVDNYYTGEKMKITLDPMLTASENAQRYYDRYAKLKRTAKALDSLTGETRAEIGQLRSVLVALDFAENESDLAEIREELVLSGLLKRRGLADGASGGKKAAKARIPKSRPLHYKSRDGYDIYVGKNNLQNDEITFKLAGNSDLWFHANDMPGSHVVLKTLGRPLEELPDSVFEDAAALAAYYSSGRAQGKVEIDYLFRRDVKKPGGAKPGFVVYYTNYSILASTDISGLTLLP